MIAKNASISKIVKISGYILFVVLTFTGSLLFMPFEIFLLSTIVVLIALRGLEKELGDFNVRNLKAFETHATRTKR